MCAVVRMGSTRPTARCGSRRRDSRAPWIVLAGGADRSRLHLTTRGDERPCGALAEGSGVRGVRDRWWRGGTRERAPGARSTRRCGRARASASVAHRGPLAALRHRRFRLFSAGVLLSLTGNWVEAAAFGYVVLLLGGSPAALGIIGFLNTIPNLVWGFRPEFSPTAMTAAVCCLRSRGRTWPWQSCSRCYGRPGR